MKLKQIFNVNEVLKLFLSSGSNVEILYKAIDIFDKYKSKYEELQDYVRLDIKIAESTFFHPNPFITPIP